MLVKILRGDNGSNALNGNIDDDYEKRAMHEIRPKQIAIPHQYYSLPSKLTSTARGQHVNGSDKLKRPPSIDDVYSFYETRGFLVQYVEEIMEINDGCVFRLQVPYPYKSGIGNKNINPFLSVDLMWADVEEDDMGAIIGLKKGRFKPVARAEMELKGLFDFNNQKPLHHYTPLLFDDTHFCQTGILIHSTLQNIKFRPRSDEEVTIRRQHRLLSVNEKKLDETDQAVHVSNVNGTPDKSGPNANVSMGNSPQEKPNADRRFSAQGPSGDKNHTSSLGFLNETFAAFLFPAPPSVDIITDGSIFYTSPLNEHLVRADDLYQRYVGPLILAYRNLLDFIKLVIENFFAQSLHEKHPHLGSMVENAAILNDANMKKGQVVKTKLREEISKGRPTSEHKLFSSKIATASPNAITAALLQSMNMVAGEIALLWHQFIEIAPKSYREMETYLRNAWEKNAAEYCKKSIVTQALRKKHLVDPPDLDSTETNAHAAQQLREDGKYVNNSEDDELLRIFDHGMFSSRRNGCVLFRNTYDASKKSEYQKYMEEEQASNRQRSCRCRNYDERC